MSLGASNLAGLTSLLGTGASSAAGASGSLGQNDFLKLLITELENQDPTQPLDPTQQVSQLAQFSSLEQMTNLNSAFSQFAQIAELTQGAALIGKNVSVSDGNGNTVKGAVQSVNVNNGNVYVQINNQSYPINSILSLG